MFVCHVAFKILVLNILLCTKDGSNRSDKHMVTWCHGGARANNDPSEPTSPEKQQNKNNNPNDPHLPHKLCGTRGTSASSHGLYQKSSTVRLSFVSVSLWHSEAAEKPVKRVRTVKTALLGSRRS